MTRSATHRTLLVRLLLACSAALFALAVAMPLAAMEPLPFEDAAEEARFRQLASELRCVMCQNQSLADSGAGIADDLRREVFRLMREGRSDAEIKQFLTDRYGEFVLYRPTVTPRTWLLWFGPALLVLAGAVVLVVVVRRRAANLSDAPRTGSGEEW